MPQPPANPKVYHIVHVDRLSSIVADDFLWSDAVMVRRHTGTRDCLFPVYAQS